MLHHMKENLSDKDFTFNAWSNMLRKLLYMYILISLLMYQTSVLYNAKYSHTSLMSKFP